MKYIRGCKITQLIVADEFYYAYKICFNTGTSRIYSIPGFVNGLFACELYLKILVGKKVNKLEKNERHNLNLLYNLLEPCQKEKLKSVPIDKRYLLEDLLKNIGDGFKEWRYIYEDDNEDFGDKHPFEYTEVFLEYYLEELSKMAHEKEAP